MDSPAPLLIYMLDRTISTWNVGAERLFGLSAAQTIGRLLDDVLQSEQIATLERHEAKLLDQNADEPFEMQLAHADGHANTASFQLSTVKDVTGQLIGIACIGGTWSSPIMSCHAAFLNRLDRMLMEPGDVNQSIDDVLRELRAYLQAQLVTCFELSRDGETITIWHEHRDSGPSALGTYSTSDYLPAEVQAILLAGQDFVCDDLATDPRLVPYAEEYRRHEVMAFVIVPVGQAANGKTGLCVAAESPRHWLSDEIELTREVAVRLLPSLKRVAAEKALDNIEEQSRRLHEQLHLVIEAMAVPVCRCSRDLRYAWVSGPYATWLGRTSEEIVGRPMAEILGADTFERALPFIRKVLSGQEVRHEFEVNVNNRGRRWVRAMYTPTFDESQKVEGWVAVILDIDDRKRAEQALAERAAQQAAVAALGQLALVERDVLAFMDICVRTVADVLSVPFCKILESQPNGNLLLRAGVGWRDGLVGTAQVSAGKESQAGYTLASSHPIVVTDLRRETRFDAPPLLSEHGIISGISCTIPGPKGSPYGVLGGHASQSREFTAEDIHFVESVAALLGAAIQRDHFEEGLRAKNEELRSATQQLWQAAKLATVGELAASVAHELNNPLATIALRVETILKNTPENDPRRRALEIIDRESKRMGRLVSELLQFSHHGQEQIELLDIRHELVHAVELVQHLLKKRRISVVLELEPATPKLYGDRQKLCQVFLNLFTNASDAMASGGTLTVRTKPYSSENGEAVIMEVVDTGCAIANEHLDKIFDPFFTTKEEGRGTGLGLPICRRVIEEHDGTIQVSSQVGVGTTVRIVLPISHSHP